MGEIIPSESLSRVTYTGINSMHSQKTKQPYIRNTRKNRTRERKNTVEEDPRKIPQKNLKKKKKKKKEEAEINIITEEGKPYEKK